MSKTFNTIKLIAVSLIYTSANGLVFAQNVKIENAWVRTAVEGQKGTGGFMKLTADQDMQLVSISTPVAGLSEVHEMKMEGDVMKMRAVPGGIALPAGKAVELQPGGFHLMLLDLKQGLPKDTSVPMTLVFKDKAGKEVKVELSAPVLARAPAGKESEHNMHKH